MVLRPETRVTKLHSAGDESEEEKGVETEVDGVCGKAEDGPQDEEDTGEEIC